MKKSIKASVASIIVFKLLNEKSSNRKSNPTNQLEMRNSQSLIFPKKYLVKIKLIYDTYKYS